MNPTIRIVKKKNRKKRHLRYDKGIISAYSLKKIIYCKKKKKKDMFQVMLRKQDLSLKKEKKYISCVTFDQPGFVASKVVLVVCLQWIF